MIYLVSRNKSLFESEHYKTISSSAAVNIIAEWDRIQFDTETTGRDPHICKVLCAQFGNKKANTQIIVDTLTVDLLLFKDLLETKLIIGHNLKFDIQFLFQYKIIPTKVWDTMIAEQFLYLGYDNKFFHYGLKDVVARRLNIDVDKTVRGEIIWRGLDDSVILYAAGDVMYLEDVMEQQKAECIKRKALKGVLIENAFVPAIAYLEWCGIKLDIEKWKKKIADNERKRDEALEKLNGWVVNYYEKHEGSELTIKQDFMVMTTYPHKVPKWYDVPKDVKVISEPFDKIDSFGCKERYVKILYKFPYVEVNRQGDLFSGFDTRPKCNLNWGSPKQTIPFFQLLGFNTEVKDKKTGETKESVVEKVLAKQKGIADDFLKVYFKYKEAAKDCSTYGQNYIDAINPNTGRIHTTFWQLGAASGRMSCGSRNSNTDLAKLKHISPSKCKYVQLQNLPADEITRSSFIASEGNLMTSCDYSALESRLGADIYQEPEMINEFLYGSGDIHSLCAKLVFREELKNIDVKDVKEKRPDLRKKVKPIEFSQQFGGGAGAVADALGCSKEEAKIFVNAYANGFKGISEFKKRGSAFVRNNGYIIICKHTGHRIIWQDWKKWKSIEDLPDVVFHTEYSPHERLEHRGAGAKWDRLALNVVTQGTGIIILKTAMAAFFKWICNNGYFNKVLLCDLVHDEAVIEYPKELLGIVDLKLKDIMEKAANLFCKSVPIPAEPETGLYWIH